MKVHTDQPCCLARIFRATRKGLAARFGRRDLGAHQGRRAVSPSATAPRLRCATLVGSEAVGAVAMRWHGRRVTVYAYARPTDMRRGFDGLCALIAQGLHRNVLGELERGSLDCADPGDEARPDTSCGEPRVGSGYELSEEFWC
jgi:hypothetical protein